LWSREGDGRVGVTVLANMALPQFCWVSFRVLMVAANVAPSISLVSLPSDEFSGGPKKKVWALWYLTPGLEDGRF
jgi:hypothetical protein